VVAQEVEEVFPELISTYGGSEWKAVSYPHPAGLAWAATIASRARRRRSTCGCLPRLSTRLTGSVVEPPGGLGLGYLETFGQVAEDVPRLLAVVCVDQPMLVVDRVEIGDETTEGTWRASASARGPQSWSTW